MENFIPRSHLAGLARFSYKHKLNFICVNKGHVDLADFQRKVI